MANGSCSKEGTIDLKQNTYYNVKVYDKPQTKGNGTFCNEVWTKNGGCCATKDAAQFATNWLHAVKKNANSTRVIMPIFKNSLEYINVVKAYSVKNKATITKKEMTTKQYDDYQGMLTNYIEGIHFFSDREEAYNQTLEKCYETLYTLRANAVCLRCSGNFGDFYNKKQNAIDTSEETCKTLVGNCTKVFAYNAEINTFFRRLQQMKAAAGGHISETHSKGMLFSEVMQFKMCASDLTSCMADEKMLHSICWEFTAGDMNPDVEGDSNVWTDGLKAMRDIVLGRKLKHGKRILEENKFNKWIAEVEKVNFYTSRNYKNVDLEANDRGTRFLASSVTTHSSSHGSGSSSSSGKHKTGLYLGHLNMVFRKGCDIFKDFQSGASITPDFSTAEALQAGSNSSPAFGSRYSLIGGLVITFALFFFRI